MNKSPRSIFSFFDARSNANDPGLVAGASPARPSRRGFGPITTRARGAGAAAWLLSCVLAQAATVGDPNNPSGLSAAIQSAYNGGSRSITVTPGTYSLPGTLYLTSISNATITATGVTLSFTSTGNGVNIRTSTNLVFDGATIRYAKPLFSQAKILAFGTDSTNGAYYDVQIDAGYPFTADFIASDIFDPVAAKIKFNTADMTAQSTQALDSNGKTRVFWGTSAGYLLPSSGYNVAPGDYLVCRGGGAALLLPDTCTNCTFENLTLYWGGGFGIFEIGPGAGNRYLNDRIIRGPIPPGATHAPLISQSADGLHSLHARVGPDIENCYFENMLDDGIAIHGNYTTVTAVSGNTITVGADKYAVGDIARLSNSNGYIAQSTVQAVQFLGGTSYLVTLAANIGAHVNDLAGSPSISGPGYKIINNTIKNNRARGMLLKADNGLVQGNTIDGSTNSGISIGPEQPNECDYCSNVTVTNNSISNTNYANNNRFYNGGIWLHGGGAQGNKGIVIQNNKLDSILGPNLIVEWTNGAQINSNVFSNTHSVSVGSAAELTTVVWLANSNNVSFTSNAVTHAGPFATSLNQAASTATNITNPKSGLYLVTEAEDLAVANFAGPAPRTFTDGSMSNGTGVIIDATAVGQSMTLLYPNVPPGDYDVQIGLKDFNPRGIFQLSIGVPNAVQTNYGTPVDEYVPSQSYPVHDFGTWSAHNSTTDKWFQFSVTGKNASSSGYSIAVDFIKLIPQ